MNELEFKTKQLKHFVHITKHPQHELIADTAILFTYCMLQPEHN